MLFGRVFYEVTISGVTENGTHALMSPRALDWIAIT
jgi:hypothetical protein